MRRTSLICAAVFVVLAVAAPGCGGGDDSGGDEAASSSFTTTTTAPVPIVPAVAVTARDYGFEAPAVVGGGVTRVTLQNNGQRKHEAVIISTGETPLDQVMRDLTPSVLGEGKPMPAYLRFYGGVSLVPGGTSAETMLPLPAGRYALVCTLTDLDSLDSDKAVDDAKEPSPEAEKFHFERGMVAAFEVQGTSQATMPVTDGTIVARDWSFELPPLAPGARTLTFRNDGQQDHSLAVAEWADGIGLDAARTAFEMLLAASPEKPPPDGTPTPEDLAFAGPLSAGGQGTFRMELKPNRTYVFACYMSDRSGGDLHALGKRMVAYAATPPG
jgi:hypothetical protein